MVLTWTYDTEELKRILVQGCPDFELRPSRKRGATYKILYHRSGWTTLKVDVLIPGILNIPDIPLARVRLIDGLPVMPLLPLLLLKLQAWWHHRTSDRIDYRGKQYTDVRDIRELLPIAARRGEHKRDAGWLPSSFLSDAERHVELFVALAEGLYGDNVERDWQAIGFKVRLHVPSKRADTKVAASVVGLGIVQFIGESHPYYRACVLIRILSFQKIVS